MNREYAEILIQRSLDSTLTEAEKAELSRALREDALLRAELEDMQTVHAAAMALFQQLEPPRDFSQRVMKRIQPAYVPADQRPESGRRHSPKFIRHGNNRLVYWAAAFSTAAAVVLTAALILQISGPLGVVIEESSRDGGRQGVPGVSGGNRTDPLSRDLENRGAPEPEQGTGASQLPTPQPPEGDARQANLDRPRETQPASNQVNNAQSEPQPIKPAESTRKDDKPAADSGPGPSVEKSPVAEPKRDTQAGPPAAPALVGRLSILNGRVELATADGKWQQLKGDEELRQGAQIRTSVVGNANVVLANGTLTLSKGTVVTLSGPGRFGLEGGAVALDKPLQADSDYLAVHCDSYVFYVKNGAASVERKRQKLNVQHFVGLSTLTHDGFGSVVFEKAATLEMELGKDYPAARLAPGLVVPDWLVKARYASLWAELEPKVAGRFGNRERRFIDQRLPAELNALMATPLDRGAVLEFMARALENKKLDSACVVDMVRELQAAIAEIKGSVPDNLAIHGARAAMNATTVDFATWRDAFTKLARGDSGKRIVTETWRKVTSESSEPGRIKPIEPPSVPPPEQSPGGGE